MRGFAARLNQRVQRHDEKPTEHADEQQVDEDPQAARLLDEGIYVIGFFFPVVPKGKARIRVQLSAAHEQQHLDKAIAAFTKIGKELGVLKEAVA